MIQRLSHSDDETKQQSCICVTCTLQKVAHDGDGIPPLIFWFIPSYEENTPSNHSQLQTGSF